MLGGLQEVVVTANHRETSAQDLPISITPVTGAALEQAGIADIAAAAARSMAGVDYTDKGLLRTTQIVILRPVTGPGDPALALDEAGYYVDRSLQCEGMV